MTPLAIDPTLLAGDEQLLVPRLVARIAELEHQLYSAELRNGEEAGVAGTGLLDKFASLLKRAQHSLDASVAYMCVHEAPRPFCCLARPILWNDLSCSPRCWALQCGGGGGSGGSAEGPVS
jgi:hypothetical protein